MNTILQQVDALYEANKGPEAEKVMLAGMKQAMDEQDDACLLQLLNELMGYYRETSQVENSYRIAKQAISLAERMGLKDSIPYATTLLNAANAYRAGGSLQDSLELYLQVREVYDKALSEDNMLIASFENNLSLLYQEMGDFEKAKEALLKALPIVAAKDAEFEVA
ncbi:MAG: tetratricopeptide repeat protein, partial [Acetatifactor sp.]